MYLLSGELFSMTKTRPRRHLRARQTTTVVESWGLSSMFDHTDELPRPRPLPTESQGSVNAYSSEWAL